MRFKRIVVIFLSITFNSSICCLENTFNNANVTVNGIRGLDVITGCFDDPEKYGKVTLIQAINQTIPYLYEDSIADLENLVTIILEKDEIQDIFPGAFRNLPNVTVIRITHNNIYSIREGVFNYLPVSELNLQENNIYVIEARAFDNIENLNILLLDKNKISEWNSDWFAETPRITKVSVQGNDITIIPSKAFKNLHSTVYIEEAETNIPLTLNFKGNKISTLEKNAFEGLESIGWLFLQNNELEEIRPESLGSLQKIEWLRLEHNRLTCIPDKLVELVDNIKFYLGGNNLTEECRQKLDNLDVDKFFIDIQF